MKNEIASLKRDIEIHKDVERELAKRSNVNFSVLVAVARSRRARSTFSKQAHWLTHAECDQAMMSALIFA